MSEVAKFHDSECGNCGRYIDPGAEMTLTQDGDYLCSECTS